MNWNTGKSSDPYVQMFNSYLWLNFEENDKENIFIQAEVIGDVGHCSCTFNRFNEFIYKETEEASCSFWDDY